ncbi:MAG TPA: DGQHR domain-containing protein [Saccharofermentans sp.]|nr:DGQHR domain-containing protein [Saccharofermentans sp.]
MRIQVIKIEQPIGTFYIGKMMAKKLYSLSKSDIADLQKNAIREDEYVGNQRKLIISKVKKISRYIDTNSATFPASIILNLSEEYLVLENDNYLDIEENENTFIVIDGQHRLAGFEQSSVDFEVPVSIFIGLDSGKQTRIFTTINTTQTKVNGSLSLFLEKNDPIWTPRKMIVNIAEMFNNDLKSPLRSRIKFNVLNEEIDKESSIISLQAFGGNILDLIYDDDKDFYRVKDWNENGNDIRQLNDIDKRLLWAFYEERREDMLYKILFNYFSSIRDAFPEEWKDKKSILVKTTGYNAFMYVFQYLGKKGLEKGDLSKEFFDQYMCKIKKMKGSFNTNVFGGSGLQESNRLAMVIMNQMGLFDEEMKNLNS